MDFKHVKDVTVIFKEQNWGGVYKIHLNKIMCIGIHVAVTMSPVYWLYCLQVSLRG